MARKVFKRKKPVLYLLILIFIFIILVSLFNGCATSAETPSNETLNIVCTTTMIGDLIDSIAGEKANVSCLMGPGIDPHLYQASAGDVRKLNEANLIVYNGLHLEGKMNDIFKSFSKRNKNIICIEDAIDESDLLSKEDNSNQIDPHIWFDISLWKDAAKHVYERISELDSKNSDYYLNRYNSYLSELTQLQNYALDRANELPLSKRILITSHDAFSYFGRAYSFEARALQGVSTDSEAGTADISALADYIAENQIKAIFIESSVSPKTCEALKAASSAKGFDVNIGGELYSDSLGSIETKADTYISVFKHNIDTIVDALK